MTQHMQRLFLIENQYEETRERLKGYLVGVDLKVSASLSFVSFFNCNYLPTYGIVGKFSMWQYEKRAKISLQWFLRSVISRLPGS